MLKLIIILIVAIILTITIPSYNSFSLGSSFNEIVQISSGIATTIIALLTLVIVHFNLKQLEELKKQREISRQPIIFITEDCPRFELRFDKEKNLDNKNSKLVPSFIFSANIEIINIGDSPALNIYAILKIRYLDKEKYTTRQKSILEYNLPFPIIFENLPIPFEAFIDSKKEIFHWPLDIQIIFLYGNGVEGHYKTSYKYNFEKKLDESGINFLQSVQDFIKNSDKLDVNATDDLWVDTFKNRNNKYTDSDGKIKINYLNMTTDSSVMPISLKEYNKQLKNYKKSLN